MDSREGAPARQNMMIGPGSYSAALASNHDQQQQPPMMISNYGQFMPSNGEFPFNSAPPRHQDAMSLAVYDGSSASQSLRSCGGDVGAENARKKRGRPRKYVPDGNIALGLAPAPPPALPQASASASPADNSGGTENQIKRNRGRPPGSGKKQLDALGGTGGIGFTPHVIIIEVGEVLLIVKRSATVAFEACVPLVWKAFEDIVQKINAFSMQGPRSICILSATGAICNPTLCQPTTPSNAHGHSLKFEGRFDIICLSGSFLVSSAGDHKRDGSLSVSLAGADGHVVGGKVCEEVLVAASLVQIIVGSFIEDGKKTSSNVSPPPQQMLSFDRQAAAAASSPPSHGGSSGSSGENGNSPMDHGAGLFRNTDQPPIHNLLMYQHPWGGQTQQ